MKIECGGLTFISDFDSGNLDKVEFVSESNKLTVTDKSSGGSSSSSPSYLNSTLHTPAAMPPSTSHSEPRIINKEIRNIFRASQSVPNDATLRKANAATSSAPTKNFIHSPTFKKHFKIFEFNIWTKPDCKGTPFENSFRSWFYFGIEGCTTSSMVKINVMNLNRQGKLYFYGMRPVYKIVPGKDSWRRIPGKVHYRSEIDGNFVISFAHPLPTQIGSVIYFAFTYPFTYSDCLDMLNTMDKKQGSSLYINDNVPPENFIYYCRELLCYSLDGRRIEIITITSFRGFTAEREERLPHLFPDHSKPRCHIFCNKKVVFLSSRVHPGETPSSFVFNGFLRTLLCPKDPKASRLRHLFVFKLIPLLNPDGVWRGHFRTDSRGVNLNRTYLIATPDFHPSVFAARSLLLYYHNRYSSPPTENMMDILKENQNNAFGKHTSVNKTCAMDNAIRKPVSGNLLKASSEIRLSEDDRHLSVDCPTNQVAPSINTEAFLDRSLSASAFCLSSAEKAALLNEQVSTMSKLNNKSYLESFNCSGSLHSGSTHESAKTTFSPPCGSQLSVEMSGFRSCSDLDASDVDEEILSSPGYDKMLFHPSNLLNNASAESSGISYYIDLHGHACKRGCFIYGNYFADIEKKVECMLLAKLMSINCPYFDFAACNFSAENMHSGGKKDGLSKEGSGRVSLNTFTGIVHSYTLECNYNTSRAALNSETVGKSAEFFSPEIFEQIGEALLVSILDASGRNPQSYVPFSSFGSLQGVRDWLRNYTLSVHNKSKSDFLKKNILNLRMGKFGSKEKAPMSCPSPLLKFSGKALLQRDPASRVSRLAQNAKRNLKSSSVSNEKFLTDFEVQYKRLHASNSKLDHLRTPGKCLDSLKTLLSPKMKSFGAAKGSSKATVAQGKKGKGSQLLHDKADRHSSREPSSESLVENLRKSKGTTVSSKTKTKDRSSDELKAKKLMTSALATSRKATKVKKKGALSDQAGPTNLLKHEGNIRGKKTAKKVENC